MRKSNDYDSTFKTLKSAHKRLFISVINEVFGKNYPLSSDIIETLPSEGILLDGNPESVEKKIAERNNDFLLRIMGDYYLIESQVYDDDTMALRIAEYTFLTARQTADVSQAEVTLHIPHFTVFYIKTTKDTPRTTTITYNFPNGENVSFTENNIFLSDYSKEDIIDKKLYPFIPFYIARYEQQLKSEKNIEKALEDLAYLSSMMIQLAQNEELTPAEYTDLRDAVIRIISHITDGNSIESEVIHTMGGEIYETESQRLIREATEPLKAELADTKSQLADKDSQLADKDSQLAEMEAENARLRALLAATQ